MRIKLNKDSQESVMSCDDFDYHFNANETILCLVSTTLVRRIHEMCSQTYQTILQ